MTDTVRALALLLSVLLWSPVAPGLVNGTVPAEKALLMYVASLLLCLLGCGLLSALVRAYTPVEEPAPPPAAPAPTADVVAERRAEDALT